MKKLLIFIVVIVILIFSGYFYYDRYLYFEELDFSLEPIQNNINVEDIQKIEKERNGVKFYIEPKAEYEIEALLISKEKYHSWNIAQIVPYDLALVWGDLAREENIKNLDYGQNLRFVNYRYSYDKMPLSDSYIKNHISNNHVIPANESVYNVIKRYKVNRVIHLKGYLVKAYIPSETSDGYGTMDSSMIRTDSGDGACEVIYVEEAW